MSEPAQNTDRELWREQPGDYYADSLYVTEGGGIGMNVGGFVIVMPIRKWHALAKAQQQPTPGDAVHPGVRAGAAGAGDPTVPRNAFHEAAIIEARSLTHYIQTAPMERQQPTIARCAIVLGQLADALDVAMALDDALSRDARYTRCPCCAGSGWTRPAEPGEMVDV